MCSYSSQCFSCALALIFFLKNSHYPYYWITFACLQHFLLSQSAFFYIFIFLTCKYILSPSVFLSHFLLGLLALRFQFSFQKGIFLFVCFQLFKFCHLPSVSLHSDQVLPNLESFFFLTLLAHLLYGHVLLMCFYYVQGSCTPFSFSLFFLNFVGDLTLIFFCHSFSCKNSNPKERQCQRMFKLPYNYTHLTHQQSNTQNSPSRASIVCELRTSRCSSWMQKTQRNQRSNCQHLLDHRKSKSSRKTSTLLTTPKPLTVWITTNCGKFLKRWEYQTT